VDDYEYRILAERPEFSAKGVADGTYFRQWETWLSDHVPGREHLLRLHTAIQKDLLRRPVVNGVSVGDEAVLLSGPSFLNWDPYIWYAETDPMCDRLAAISRLVEEQGGTFYYVGLPDRLDYLKEHYPDYMRPDETNMFCYRDAFVSGLAARNVRFVDVEAAYEAEGHPEHYFFTGDHHFTFDGAFSAYQAIMRTVNEESGLGLSVWSQDDLDYQTFPNPCLGTYDRKLYGLRDEMDQMTYGVPKNSVSYQRLDEGVPTEIPLFQLPATSWEDINYRAFMGGDWGQTILRTHRPELPDCLIVGDSYTNALEGLLYASFDETHSLDLRYYAAQSLPAYVETFQPDVVIYVRGRNDWYNLDGNGNVWTEEEK